MKFGVLKDDSEKIQFKDFKENNIVKNLQKIVGGDILYKSLKEVFGKNIKGELQNVSLVLNDEYKTKENLRPTILFEGEMLIGNIVFVGVEKEDKKFKTIGLTENQIKELPEFFEKYIISEKLKKAFGI